MSVPAPHYLLFSAARRSPAAKTAVKASTAPARRRGRWEFVLESLDGSTRIEVADQEEDVPGTRLELLAVVRGLEAIDQPSRVTLLTPSAYVHRGLRFGLSQWRDNNWRWESFGRMVPVRNADLWQRLDRAMRIHDVRCRTWRLDPAPATPQSQANRTDPHPAAPTRRRAVGQRAGAPTPKVEGWLSRLRRFLASLLALRTPAWDSRCRVSLLSSES